MENENNTPAWLEELADGSIKVRFDKGREPVIDGTKVGELTMREPDVNDQITAGRGNVDQGEAEVTLIANLCEISPDAVKAMKIRPYGRLQAALAVFYA